MLFRSLWGFLTYLGIYLVVRFVCIITKGKIISYILSKLDLYLNVIYYIGYSERSRGSKFYNPTKHLVFESENAEFFEDNELMGGDMIKDNIFEEKYMNENETPGQSPSFVHISILLNIKK